MSKPGWWPYLGILERDLTYEERLDAALARVAQQTGLPGVYLYVLDDAGGRLHLERALSAPGERSEAVEGGAEAIESMPPLELAAAPGEWEGRVVTSPAGLLWSVELPDTGVIQVGPLRGQRPRGRVRAVLDELRYPLAFVVGRARTERRLTTELGTLSARLDAGQKLAGSALDLRRYVDLLLELALRATRTEAGFVAIVDAQGALAIEADYGLPHGFAGTINLDPERGFFDWAAAGDGGALFVRDAGTAAELGIRSVLAVPLLEGEQRLGIFALVNFGEAGTFSEGSLELLATFADQIRQMLQNDRVFRDFAQRFLETVKGLAASLDVRRPHTHGHHERVSAIAASIARELGHSTTEVEAVAIAGLVHDAGMAGAGTGGYQADIDHPAVGAGLVEQLPLHAWVAPSIGAHHEWWDGWGFPRGISGDEIPRGGAILAAAEFIDEMASGDPVREPYPPERLVAELEIRRGSQFSPDVADAAIRVIREDSR
jgi:GAF domain-containing protein